jgi:phosphoadenosine phosphosulfate reductase
MLNKPWTPEILQQLNDCFKNHPPEEILRWALGVFSPDIALATNFGPGSIVLMHLIMQIRPKTAVFYLDTDLMFPETYALRDKLASRLGCCFIQIHSGLSLETQAAQYGPALWSHEPNLCCYLRKVEPLSRFLATQHAWITGIRRDQTATRAKTKLVEWDNSYKLVKFNPLADWSIEQVWSYIQTHNLPFNSLHLQGYPSIGCGPCTRPVESGEDSRAGRWAGWDKTECGIHL